MKIEILVQLVAELDIMPEDNVLVHNNIFLFKENIVVKNNNMQFCLIDNIQNY